MCLCDDILTRTFSFLDTFELLTIVATVSRRYRYCVMTLLMEHEGLGVSDCLEAWMEEIFDASLLAKALKEIEGGSVCPPKERMFAAFKVVKPRDVKVVILGQDPYPTPGVACGFSFAVKPDVAVPASLKAIFECLRNFGFAGDDAEKGRDLMTWAIQGVLLMNVALTVGEKPGSHRNIWSDFTTAALGELCRINERVIFILWGNFAKEFSPIATGCGRHVLTWTHPSPLADNKLPAERRFKNCTNFAEANALLGPENAIDWNPCLSATMFTDGACTGNGTDKAKAGFGVVICCNNRITTVCGPVPPYGIDSPEGVLTFDQSSHSTPTNNRAEGLALCCALIIGVQAIMRGKIIIVSDSALWIKLLCDWYPARCDKGTEGELKNLDMLQLASEALTRLRENASVDFMHVNSHTPRPTEGRFEWEGNSAADRLAVKGIDAQEIKIKGPFARMAQKALGL